MFAADAAQPAFPLAVRWTVDIPAPPVANAPPLSDETNVYLALRSAEIVARRVEDGSQAWRRALATERPLAADGGLVFVASADAVHALRSRDGAIAWEAPVHAATAPLLARGGWLVAAADGNVLAFRGADGTLVWQRAVGAVTARPAIDGDRLYVAVDDGRVLALNVTTGAPAWERRLSSHPSTPLAWGDRVYVGGADRQFYCLKAVDGEIDWSWRVGAAVNTLPAGDGSRVYFVGLDNVLRALDRVTGVQQWQHGLERRPAAGPVVLQQWVLVPSSSSAEIWAWTVKGRAAGTIATPAEPAVPPEFGLANGEGAEIYVITGGLARVWQLTRVGTAGDPPAVPLLEMPGTLAIAPGTPVSVERPRS